MTFTDDELRAKLKKLEALFRHAGTHGERNAAGAAIGRLKERLGNQTHPEVELKFSFPDGWAVRLFLAVCRKHGLRPYRYPRQRRTTIMVRAREREFDSIVWPEFSSLLTELTIYFEEIVDHLVTDAMRVDTDDAEQVAELGR